MRIKLKALSAIGNVIGEDLILELKGNNTAKDLLEKLDSLYGEDIKRHTGEKLMDAIKRYNMIVRKKALRFPEDLNYEFKDNDNVVLLHVTGGG